MQHWRFYAKFAAIAFIMLLLLIPQAFIFSVVQEREGWREQAYQSIGQSWPREQTLVGPLLVLPYQVVRLSKERVVDAKGKEREVVGEEWVQSSVVLMPQHLNISSQLETTLRHRGIYAVPVYSSQLQVKGAFDPQQVVEAIARVQSEQVQWGKPYLSVAVSDQRGIVNAPTLQWVTGAVPFQPGSNLKGNEMEAGMHALLPVSKPQELTNLAFQFDLSLNGMRGMNFALLSRDTQIRQSANWASPSFMGDMLPSERKITATGFDAVWQASAFSVNANEALEQCQRGDCGNLTKHTVGVNLIQPVDVYQQAERSVKYALLFIVLTFGVLMLFELLKRLRIHPVQYTLVGFALLVFYLLLISLSEHMAFIMAYALAASASTGLLTLYFGAILRSRRLGWSLGAGLASLYALLYLILQAEENALLMGSLLLFVVLAVLMLGTRHFDWYALMGKTTENQSNSGSAQNLQKTSLVSP